MDHEDILSACMLVLMLSSLCPLFSIAARYSGWFSLFGATDRLVFHHTMKTLHLFVRCLHLKMSMLQKLFEQAVIAQVSLASTQRPLQYP